MPPDARTFGGTTKHLWQGGWGFVLISASGSLRRQLLVFFKLRNASPVWHALRSRRADTVRVHRGALIMRIIKNRDYHRADGPAYC